MELTYLVKLMQDLFIAKDDIGQIWLVQKVKSEIPYSKFAPLPKQYTQEDVFEAINSLD